MLFIAGINLTTPLRRGETHVENTMECERESFSGALGGARETYQVCFTLP